MSTFRTAKNAVNKGKSVTHAEWDSSSRLFENRITDPYSWCYVDLKDQLVTTISSEEKKSNDWIILDKVGGL